MAFRPLGEPPPRAMTREAAEAIEETKQAAANADAGDGGEDFGDVDFGQILEQHEQQSHHEVSEGEVVKGTVVKISLPI